MKRLDRRLANILNGSTSSGDFIIADAKDADMAFGVTAVPRADPVAGRRRHRHHRHVGGARREVCNRARFALVSFRVSDKARSVR